MAVNLDVSWAMGSDDDEDDEQEPYFMLDHLDRSFWKWVSQGKISFR